METSRIVLLGGVFIGMASATPVLAQKTFHISEVTDFTGNGCEFPPDLNTVTQSLRNSLETFGWTGTRHLNPAAFPQDFQESCSATFGPGGLDASEADTKTLTIYAGHGAAAPNLGKMIFGFPHDGVCTVRFQDAPMTTGIMRLGSMSGAAAGYGMWLTSCSLEQTSWTTQANFQWLRQNFGYHNSPTIGKDTPKQFFFDTELLTNRNSWLVDMEDRPGLFTGENSPVVITYGSDPSDCFGVRDTASGEGNALGQPGVISFVGDGLNDLDILGGVGANEFGRVHGGVAGLEEVLVSSGGELAKVIRDSLVLGVGANLLERGNRHSGQEADNDDNDHDFDKGETLG